MLEVYHHFRARRPHRTLSALDKRLITNSTCSRGCEASHQAYDLLCCVPFPEESPIDPSFPVAPGAEDACTSSTAQSTTMVVKTPSLHSVKRGLLPPIHQALPLSKRQSQQLLDTITTSFRKNLDLEHPWQAPESSKTAVPSTKYAGSANSATTSSSIGKTRPTDRHLRSILANPFFSQASHESSLPGGADATSITKQLYIFDAAVAQDLMNTRRAFGFLVTIRNKLAESSDPTYTIANTGAGFRVLRWLRSSNQEASMRFLSNGAFATALIPFLYAEGLEEVAWEWLSRLANPSFVQLDAEVGTTKLSEQPLTKLFAAMMHEYRSPAAEPAHSLNLSYSNHLRAHQTLSDQSRLAQANLKNNWVLLSWQSTVEAWKRAAPSRALFEDFVESGRPLKRNLDLAHLELHHPTDPSSRSALSYMHQHPALAISDISTRLQEIKRQRVICLALDAVDRLKQAGNANDASWVERFLTSVCQHLNFGTADTLYRGSSLVPLGRLNRYMNLT
ncbi:hypothetical protein Micbo1qcDRAFT_194877 [Microdochium bolleyi]|uniref:Uncharacterized protein n=1 Tax=Microdochium bolleyi TaxID=196109 RepID=A0A136J3V1_9PEZI|nr:hypothetical protein Micbo1qcDRAFT_194877 [Microdochium bolleyi]